MNWEGAVDWLRNQPGQESLVQACYYDDPLINAAERFRKSKEWHAVTKFFPPKKKGKALDVGAGRGISSYAFAKMGWNVIALEPDPSPLVGAAAIKSLADESDLNIRVVEEFSKNLSFDNNSFDIVYLRQALHHADNLAFFCDEAFRVLKPGGRFIATREHVISKKSDLKVFLVNHPLHKLYGGENAYLLDDYVSAISKSGLNIYNILGSYDSVINYFPMTYSEWHERCRVNLPEIVKKHGEKFLTNEKYPWGRFLMRKLSGRLSEMDDTPGRLYSFIADKRLIA